MLHPDRFAVFTAAHAALKNSGITGTAATSAAASITRQAVQLGAAHQRDPRPMGGACTHAI